LSTSYYEIGILTKPLCILLPHAARHVHHRHY
jgi:hypothetical protein